MRCAGSALNLRMASSSVSLLFLAHVLAQDARERAVGARVRMLPAEQALQRGALRIVADRDPRLP